MASITEILMLGDEPDWWKMAEREDDGKPQPASPVEWLEVLRRWKAKNPSKRCPIAKETFDDDLHGKVNLGSWLSTRKREANGKTGSPEVQQKSLELTASITVILMLGDEPDWWKSVGRNN